MPMQMNREYLTSQEYIKCTGYISLDKPSIAKCISNNTFKLKNEILPRLLKVPGN